MNATEHGVDAGRYQSWSVRFLASERSQRKQRLKGTPGVRLAGEHVQCQASQIPRIARGGPDQLINEWTAIEEAMEMRQDLKLVARVTRGFVESEDWSQRRSECVAGESLADCFDIN